MGVRAAAGQQQSDNSTAAVRLNPASERVISAAVDELYTKDAGTLRQVEPLARLLPYERFRAVLELLKERRLSSPVRNDAGLFVHLLRVEVQAMRAERAAAVALHAEAAPLESKIERTKRSDPEKYIAAMKGTPVFDLEAYLVEYVDDVDERERLRRTAA